MKSAIVMDGRFRVTENGDVFRIAPDGEKPAKTFHASAQRYLYVTYMDSGKQKHIAVHRLIATAFVPNPDNLPNVGHLDRDVTNNAASNLVWCSAAQTSQRGHAKHLNTLLEKSTPCTVCGDATLSKTGMCSDCRRAVTAEHNRALQEEKAVQKFQEIDLSLLSPKEKEYVTQQLEGWTLTEIANMHGVSRQCVDGALKNALRKGDAAPRLLQKHRQQLSARINRKLARAKHLERQACLIRDEVRQEVSRINEQYPDYNIQNDIAN